MALCVPSGRLPRLRWPPPQGLPPLPSCRLRPPSLPARLRANMPRSYAPSEGILRPWLPLPVQATAAYADPRNRAPLEQGPAGARPHWSMGMSTGKPNNPISLSNPSARSAIFLKNEANHTLASLAAMAQFALVAAGVMVRRPPPRTVWMSCHSSRSGLDSSRTWRTSR